MRRCEGNTILREGLGRPFIGIGYIVQYRLKRAGGEQILRNWMTTVPEFGDVSEDQNLVTFLKAVQDRGVQLEVAVVNNHW